MLTATSDSGATLSSTGSLTIGAPGGTTANGRPPQVSFFSEPASTAPFLPASAILPAPIISGLRPYSLDRTMRSLLPPTLIRATCRTVWSASISGTPNGAGSSSAHLGAGVAAQVVIHPLTGADPSAAETGRAVNTNISAAAA